MMARRYRAIFLIGTALLLFAMLPFLPALTNNPDFYGLRIEQPAPVINDPELGRIDVPDGGLSIVFFGYQYCGTVCPLQMVNLQKLHQSLPGAPIRFVFVTLDPERDSRQHLNLVMTSYGEDFVPVRPRNNRTAQQLALSYGDFAGVQGAGADTAYDIKHSAHLYVVTASGQRKLVYTTPALDLDRVRNDLELLLADQNKVLING